MKVPFFTSARQHSEIASDLSSAIQSVVDSGNFADGPKTKEFEEKWSLLNGVKHTLFTSSGTSALEIAIKLLNIRYGSVAVPTNTFFASASQIPQECDIRFIDSDESCNVDINQLNGIERVIGVSLYGQPLNFDKLFKVINKDHYIQDSCQGHFSAFKNKPLASYCRISVYSFYCTKSVGAMGEAGAICINDDSLLEKARSLRNHGRSKEGYSHDYISGNLRGDEIQAAILLVKLKMKDSIIESRVNAVKRYKDNLKNHPQIKLLPELEDCQTVPYVMPVFVENRDCVRGKLKEKCVDTLVHYPIPLHLQPAYQSHGYSVGDLPLAEKQCNTELSLPLFYGISDDEVDYVSQSLLDIVGES